MPILTPTIYQFARASSLPGHGYRGHPVRSAKRSELQYRPRWFEAVASGSESR